MRNFLFRQRYLFHNPSLCATKRPWKATLPAIVAPGTPFVTATKFFCEAKRIQKVYLTPTESLIGEYSNCESPPWEEISEKVNSEENKSKGNVHSFILSACLKQSLVDLGISYVKYVHAKGEILRTLDYFYFIALLSGSIHHVHQQSELVKIIFNRVKSEIESHEFVQKYAFRVFSEVKDCWKELVEICLTKEITGAHQMAVGAFAFDEEKTAWELLHKNPVWYSSQVLESFMSYCIRLAEEGRFSVKILSKFVSFLSQNGFTVFEDEFKAMLVRLISVLNSDENHRYSWKVNYASIINEDSKSKCSNCGLQLKSVDIKDEEFNELKTHVLECVLKNRIFNITTTENDVYKFQNFLRNCGKYDIVFDGLNIIHMRGQFQASKLHELLNYFNKLRKTILFIGRKHVSYKKFYPLLVDKCKVFLCSNCSNDDIHVIYAAMYGGKSTSFISNDFFRGYSKNLPTERLKSLFSKWQLSHQYMMPKGVSCVEPFYHGRVAQETSSPVDGEGDYVWHFSVESTGKAKMNGPSEMPWICLKASPRARRRRFPIKR